MVACAAAVYLLAAKLAGQPGQHAARGQLAVGDRRPGPARSSTYIGATISLSGFVAARLSFFRTLLVQVAGFFITLVTPAAVGGAALNIRYLQRKKIPAAVAAASVGVAQVVAFVLHIVLIVIFAAIAGSSA